MFLIEATTHTNDVSDLITRLRDKAAQTTPVMAESAAQLMQSILDDNDMTWEKV